MCTEIDSSAAGRPGTVAVAGVQCVRLTPELRTQLQICINNVENLAAMQLPAEAHRCLARIERAIDTLMESAAAAVR